MDQRHDKEFQESAVVLKERKDFSKAVAVAGPVRLGDFIRTNLDPIVEEWVKVARTRKPASESMTHLALTPRNNPAISTTSWK